MKHRHMAIVAICGVSLFAIGCGKTGDDTQESVECTGTVQYEGGSPVANTEVFFEGKSTAASSLSVMTDDNGKFSISKEDNVTPGDYRVYIPQMDSDEPSKASFEANLTLNAETKDPKIVLKAVTK